jgi:hypothetical protein
VTQEKQGYRNHQACQGSGAIRHAKKPGKQSNEHKVNSIVPQLKIFFSVKEEIPGKINASDQAQHPEVIFLMTNTSVHW